MIGRPAQSFGVRRRSDSAGGASHYIRVVSTTVYVNWLARLRHPSFLAPLSVVISSLVIGTLGLLPVGLPWLLAGTALLTLAAFTVGRALEPGTSADQKVYALAWTAVILVIVLIGSWSYPALHRPESQKYFLVQGSDEAMCLRVAAQPGGAALVLGRQLCVGQPFAVDCQVRVSGAEWLRVATYPPYWVPRIAVQPVTDSDGDVPGCD